MESHLIASLSSPSVLDRLNPLLEPNGVLSIDGRGIVGDSVPTVTPHPNFRYFLSCIQIAISQEGDQYIMKLVASYSGFPTETSKEEILEKFDISSKFVLQLEVIFVCVTK